MDIPISAAGVHYDAEQDCRNDGCIVAQLDHFVAVSKNENAAPEQRLEALKFVVYFAGYLTQTLHCADNNDKGGNGVALTFNGKHTNLHALWDTGLNAASGMGEPDFARSLTAKITDAQAVSRSSGAIADWANDSYGVARSFIYARLADADHALPPLYQADLVPVVELQLEKGGVRLARLLKKPSGSLVHSQPVSLGRT